MQIISFVSTEKQDTWSGELKGSKETKDEVNTVIFPTSQYSFSTRIGYSKFQDKVFPECSSRDVQKCFPS